MSNNMKRVLLTAVAALLLVVMSVGATLAYLTSTTQTVKNTFTVGNVTIILNEARVTGDGTVMPDHDDRVITNSYTLQPGLTYPKDPTVTVKAGSEDCYVRVQVSVTNYSSLKTAFPDDEDWDDSTGSDVFLLQNHVVGWSAANWEFKKFTLTNNVGVYEFWYTAKVVQDDEDQVLPDLFTAIKMPQDMTNTELAALNGLEINVVAHAIQSDGFANATAAWKAWDDGATLMPAATATPTPAPTAGA